MGWSNYIIIDDWKIVIEVNRGVDEIQKYIFDSLENIINNVSDIDVSELKLSDITTKELCVISSVYENASNLFDLDIDKILLYWLEKKNIKFEIKSEFKINLSDYEANGFKVVKNNIN
jgi:hypothetical protein